jgi:hypothetical protein
MTEKSQEDRREELLTEFMMDDANADYTTIIEWINRYSEYGRDFIDLAVELVLDERRPEAMEALRAGGVKIVVELNAPDSTRLRDSQQQARQEGETPIHLE